MIKTLEKRLIVILAGLLLVCGMGFVLTSCGASQGVQDTAKSNNENPEVYYAHVNQISKNFTKALSDFQTSIKDKDEKMIKEKLSSVQAVIDEYNSIEVPDECKEVHELYSEGYSKMQQSLTDYADLIPQYNEKSKSGKVDTDLQNKVKKVQSDYNEGMNSLAKADKMVAERNQ